MRILYITATDAESFALSNIQGISRAGNSFRFGNTEIELLVSGVGTVATAWSMMKWFSDNGRPDLAINGGIAGSFSENTYIGDVVMPVEECFADAGIEDNDEFRTLFEAGLTNPDEFPFIGGKLHSNEMFKQIYSEDISKVRAITTGTTTGSVNSREKLIHKYSPDIETMEGAAFFYICARENVPFFALRAISNKVGPRNRKEWNIALALQNLSGAINDVLLKLQ
ncbi:MAG TPA: futalosine hydrolase [Bacteroidales bacterium]|nr:futalosine hydrolase [Bacteroidales bacterium]